jgi:hypothetical protein
VFLDVHETWPYCEPITRREFDFLERRRRWALEHAPDHPAARPRDTIDVLSLKPGF